MIAANSTPKRLRCALYLRMSTSDQEHSIDAQTEAAENWATANKATHKIVATYTDSGIAGDMTADKRPAFQRMLTDAANGKFDAVLVRDPSRLSRSNSIKGSRELEPLFDAGILILTVTGMRMDLSTMEGRIQLQLWFEMSHQDNRSRGLNVASAMSHHARNGSWIGTAPAGYRVVGKKGHKRLVVVDDPHEVELVQRIYRDYDNGHTIQAIQRALESEGVPSFKGNPHWCHGTISDILKNPAYAGHTAFTKHQYGKYYRVGTDGVQNHNGKRKQNDPSDWIITKDTHEPIIGQAQWDRVNHRIRMNKSCGNNNESFLLSQRVQCGECGRTMHGMTLPRTGNRQYECKSCKMTVKERELVKHVVTKLVEVFDPASIEKEVRRHVKPQSPAKRQRDRKRIETELARQERKLVFVEDNKRAVQLLMADIDRLRAELDSLESDPAETRRIDLERRIRNAMQNLARLPELVENASPLLVRDFLRETLHYVRVWTRTTGEIRKRYHLIGGEIALDLGVSEVGPTGRDLKAPSERSLIVPFKVTDAA